MTSFKETDYFILFANCLPVKGAVRSLICDLQKGNYVFIPNDLYAILKETRSKKIGDIYATYGLDNKEVIDEYLEYLLSLNMGFIDTEIELFPELDLKWEKPSTITNAILDIDEEYFSEIDYQSILEELSGFNCSCVQVRFFKHVDIHLLTYLLELTRDSRIKEVRLVLKHEPELEEKLNKKLIPNYNRITEVLYYGHEKSSLSTEFGARIITTKSKSFSVEDCGNVCAKNFVVNMDFFTEAQQYNTCLNRKISVDTQGEIKNCPSQKTSYGNVKEHRLRDILEHRKEFKDLWKVNKDEIKVCKDCEFRYICTDCRVFTEKDSKYSKPAKCNYDPYEAVWN